MIPVFQTIMHDPPRSYGNCVSACLASLLHCQIDDFMGYAPKHFESAVQWLEHIESILWHKRRRLKVWGSRDDVCSWDFNYTGEKPPGWSLITGKSPRGNWGHTCVAFNGEVFHDPSPLNREGPGKALETIWYYETIESI